MCVLLSLFWPTFQSLIYELVDEDGCSSSFDISTRITQCAGFSSIRMYDDHDEVSHWVKSEQSEETCFFLNFLARRSWYILKVSEPVSCILGTGKKYRYRYRSKLWVPSHSGRNKQNYGVLFINIGQIEVFHEHALWTI